MARYTLRAGNKTVVKTKFGDFEAIPSPDPNYPGFDIEFFSKEDNVDEKLSNPRVVIDLDEDQGEKVIKVRVWRNPDSEDYTDIISIPFA